LVNVHELGSATLFCDRPVLCRSRFIREAIAFTTGPEPLRAALVRTPLAGLADCHWSGAPGRCSLATFIAGTLPWNGRCTGTLGIPVASWYRATHCAVLGCGNVVRVHAPGPHSDLSFRVGPLELILRCILAFWVGVTLHIEYFYRFLPYGRREQQLPSFWISRLQCSSQDLCQVSGHRPDGFCLQLSR
jgi:hypothetical protein